MQLHSVRSEQLKEKQQQGVCSYAEMSHCVAVGTQLALLINITNLKVQKNVLLFKLDKNEGEERKKMMHIHKYYSFYVISLKVDGLLWKR